MRPFAAPTAALATSLLALAVGCSGGGQDWSSAADCEGLSAGSDADECWARHAPSVFKDDPARGVAIVTDEVSDPRVRDFIWLTVTREVDPSSYKYCDRIEEAALAERCRVLVSRPHLHRELLKESGGGGPKGGAQGGPPPGAGGPPPPGGGPGGPPPKGAGGPPPTGAPPPPN